MINVKNKTINYLIAASQIDRLETKLLLRAILGFTQAELIIKNDYVLSDREYDAFLQLLKKRQDGMPISYLLGYKEFYSRNFKVNSDTLIPRPETELLVETILNLSEPKWSILDLGTGCGCIAITCKLESPTLSIIAVDNSLAALSIARYNANELNADVKFAHSDWYSQINDKFDIIVSNPPYIANNDIHLKDLSYEPQDALTDFGDGLEHIKAIIAGGVKHLRSGGYLLLEHGYNQSLVVNKIFEKYSYSDITTLKDYASIDRVTYAMWQ